MKKKGIKISVITIITIILINIINSFEVIIKNRMYMLQMQNDNLSYMIFSLYKDNKHLLIFSIVVIAAFIIYRIILRGNKNE